MNIFKRFLARKKDWEELTAAEVRAALRRKEIECEKELDTMRIERFKLTEKFEKDLSAELSASKKNQEKLHQEEVNKLAQNFKDKISECDREISELKEKVKFVQRFWRSLYAEKDELHNIAIVLQSKAELSLKSERDNLQAQINKRADDTKQINICVQQIEHITRRIERQSEFGEKLLALIPEEEQE